MITSQVADNVQWRDSRLLVLWHTYIDIGHLYLDAVARRSVVNTPNVRL